MTRFLSKSVLALLAAAALGAAAPAQFFPGVRPGVYWTGPFGTYSYNQWYQESFRYNFVNPFNGLQYNYAYNYAQSGLLAYPFYAPRYYAAYPTYGNYPDYSAYAGSNNPAANPIIQQQLRLFASARPSNEPAEKPKAGAWAAVPKAPKPAAGAKPVELDQALIEPKDADVLSGKALNQLAAVIRGLEAKGARAEAPFLPPEVLAKVAYAGGPAGDLLAGAGTGKLEFPQPLAGTEYAQLRAELERPANAVMEALAAGKRVDPASATALAAAVTKAKRTVAGPVQGLPADDRKAVTQFLAGLEGLAKGAANPVPAGLVVPRWFTLGASVAELVRHADKFKLEFAAAPPGHGEAYLALHRGLAAYYAGLAQPRQ